MTYYVDLESKIDVQTIHRSYGYGYRGRGGVYGTETVVTEYEEGTLLIDIIDASGNGLLWRGSGSTRLSGSATPEKRKERVNTAVAKILEQFPPQ